MAVINLFSIKERNLFNSCKKIVTTSFTYEANLIKVPRFVTLRDSMNVVIEDIALIEKRHKDNPKVTGLTKEKNDQLLDLMNDIGSLAKTVKIIAVNQNDGNGETTANDALFTQTRNLTQEAKLQAAQDFADYALTIKSPILAEYGITEAELLVIKTQSVAIRAFFIQKDAIVEQNSTNKEDSSPLLAKLDAGKDEMAALIDRYHNHAPKFVSAFKNIMSMETRLNNQMAQKRSEDVQKDKEKKLMVQQKKLLAKETKSFLQQQKPVGKKKRPLSKKMLAATLEAQKLKAETLMAAIETPKIAAKTLKAIAETLTIDADTSV